MKWFEIILVSLTLFTGVVWLLDKLIFAKRRVARESSLLSDDKEPIVIDYSKAFFPVLLIVLILRSFIAEPFKIPSSSMMPNLLIGDFILVNKFSYGIRLPITNTKIISVGEPQRGDVMVFTPPHVSDQNWVKRVIGLPGDRISFHGNQLTVNGQILDYQVTGPYQEPGQDPGRPLNAAATDVAIELEEDLLGHLHGIIEWMTEVRPEGQGDWVVPEGQYFVMGDNRDNSEDSRFWTQTHFVPEANLKGKAFFIWLNCQGFLCKNGFNASRIGKKIN